MSTSLQSATSSMSLTLASIKSATQLEPLLPSPKPYTSLMSIRLTQEENGALNTIVQTERLTGGYLTKADTQDVINIYGSAAVMAKYSKGSTYSKEHAITRTNGWIREANNGNPWTAIKFTVDEEPEKHIIVFVEPDYIDDERIPGDLEITYFAPEAAWKKGYGTEAVTAVIQMYIPEAIRQGFTVENSPVQRLHLTARPDNHASIGVAVNCGMTYTRTTKDIIDPNDGKNWGPRYFFEKSFKDL